MVTDRFHFSFHPSSNLNNKAMMIIIFIEHILCMNLHCNSFVHKLYHSKGQCSNYIFTF